LNEKQHAYRKYTNNFHPTILSTDIHNSGLSHWRIQWWGMGTEVSCLTDADKKLLLMIWGMAFPNNLI
jgi:hypothetical protein